MSVTALTINCTEDFNSEYITVHMYTPNSLSQTLPLYYR